MALCFQGYSIHALHWNTVVDHERKRTRDAQHLDRDVNQIIIYLLAACLLETLLWVVLYVECGSICLDKLWWTCRVLHAVLGFVQSLLLIKTHI